MQLKYFLNKLVVDNSGRKGFSEKEINVSLAYNFCGVVMYFFYLINWNFECPFERFGKLIISIILCSTFTPLYIFLFYFCIEFFGTTEFHLILCVTLFQCFQEWVIRFIVNCIGSLLTVYASCTIFRFIFECQGIWVLYMDYANYVIWIHFRNWMRYKFLYLIFFELRKIDVWVMNNF